MKCIVVTPEKTEVNCETTFVVLPLYDGEYGIAPLHTPMVGRIGSGELRIVHSDGAVDRYYIEGGFAEMNGETVSVLTNRLVREKELSLSEAECSLQEAMAVSASAEKEVLAKEKEVSAARARVRTAKKWK